MFFGFLKFVVKNDLNVLDYKSNTVKEEKQNTKYQRRK